MKKHKICIVGGGLTGLISALVLSKKGLETFYQSSQIPKKSFFNY